MTSEKEKDTEKDLGSDKPIDLEQATWSVTRQELQKALHSWDELVAQPGPGSQSIPPAEPVKEDLQKLFTDIKSKLEELS